MDAIRCPHCFTTVLAKADGTCPACQKDTRDILGTDLIGDSTGAVLGRAPRKAVFDKKLESHIHNLHRASKSMVLLNVFAFLMPIIMLLAAPVGLFYAFQRSRLLKQFTDLDLDDADRTNDPTSTAAEMRFLKEHGIRFLVPAFALAVEVGVLFFMIQAR